MSYQVLARKYRPQKFCEVVGQEHITTTLKNALATGRLHHAYLFTGVRGVGKTTVARILAKGLNCTNPKDSEPCGKCTACIEITEGRSMDVQEIDGASNTGVDDVREIRERAKYMPSSGKYKIYIIDEVHMLSTPAFNALLKTLEEPPAHVVFIFATTESHKIPATILSRCQRYDFRRIPAHLTAKVLERIAKSEHVKISEEAVGMISRESTGSLRDAQSLFDQAIAFSGNDVEADSIKSMLGCLDRTLLFDLIAAALEQNPDKALSILDEVFQTGADLVRFASDALEVIRHMLVLAECGQDRVSLDLASDEIETLGALVKNTTAPQLHQIFSLWYSVAESVSRSPFPKMLLEIGLIRLCKIEPVKPIEEIVAKLDNILEGEAPSAPGAEAHLTFEPAQRNAKDVATERKWQEFMRWLAAERPQAAAILQQGSFEGISANAVKLNFTNAHYAEMLTEQERMQKACDLLSTFFKKPMKLLVNADGNGQSSKSSSKQSYKKKKELVKETLKDEIVTQAADILGAKLHDVKVETGE